MSRLRTALTAAGLVAALTLLPLGTAAADPLPPGEYPLEVDGVSITVTVDAAGSATVVVPEGTTVDLREDEVGRVLDELLVTTPSGSFEVQIDAGGGEPTVDPVDEGGDDGEGEGDTEDDEGTDGGTEGDDGEDVSDDDVDGTDGDDTDDTDDSDDEDLSDELTATDDEETVEAGHGELVSTVARCAPKGRVAREAGLPNHGTFVRAVARGQELTVELPAAGETTFDVTTSAGVDELCAALAAAVETAAEQPVEEAEETEGSAAETAEHEASDVERRAPGRSGEARGRSGEARGRSGEAPGRSGEAPGRGKKDR